MDIQHNSQGDSDELAISGRVDGAGANQLKAALQESVGTGVRTIVVDLSAATFIGSAGLGTLLQYWRQMQKKGGTLYVGNPSPPVLALIKVSGFNDMLLQKV